MLTLDTKVLRDELALPGGNNEVFSRIVDQSRWAVAYEIVFAYGDKFYRAYYRVGATEQQDEGPWEFEKTVECTEVELKAITVKQWVEVKD